MRGEVGGKREEGRGERKGKSSKIKDSPLLSRKQRERRKECFISPAIFLYQFSSISSYSFLILTRASLSLSSLGYQHR